MDWYIKRKHVIFGIQKHALKSISEIVVEITVIFRYEWSKWPFCIKMIERGHATHNSKAYEINIPKKIIFVLKQHSWELLAAKINFSEKFYDDIIIT